MSKRIESYRPVNESTFAKGSHGSNHLTKLYGLEVGLFKTGLWGLVGAIALRIDEAIAHSSVLINPSPVAADSLGLMALGAGSFFFTWPNKIRKIEEMQNQGVDIATLTNSRREKAKVLGKKALGLMLGLGSITFAASVDPPNQASTEITQPAPSFVQSGHQVKPSYVDLNGTIGEQIECGTKARPGTRSNATEIDSSNYVYYSSPDVFKLAQQGKANAINNVIVWESFDYPGGSAANTRYDFFQISIDGSNVTLGDVNDTTVNLENPTSKLTPYTGKGSRAGEWTYKSGDEEDGSFGITDYGIMRQGNTYYLGLACNTSAITK